MSAFTFESGNWRENMPESNYLYSAYSSKCEKTCLDKGVEKKDENIPMSLWNQCIGNCEQERDIKQKETWGTITNVIKDVRWGDILGGIFGKKEPDVNIPPSPDEPKGISATNVILIIVGIAGLLTVLLLVFRKRAAPVAVAK